MDEASLVRRQVMDRLFASGSDNRDAQSHKRPRWAALYPLRDLRGREVDGWVLRPGSWVPPGHWALAAY